MALNFKKRMCGTIKRALCKNAETENP